MMGYATLDVFYEGIDALIEDLRASRHEDEAQALYALMHETAWTTGSELLGELGLALKKMKGTYSLETKAKIKESIDFAVNHRRILGLN
jgi:hypothetical protein